VVPADGTPVDFAYTIHTEVGHTCVGAKVNGRMVPLRTKLRTGDIVEIVTQKDHKPSRDWLTFVKSPRARNKIKHWLNEDQRRRAVEIGRKLLEREARKHKVPMSQITDQDLGRLANEYGVATAADLLATLGQGKHSAHQVLNKLAPGYAAPAESETPAPETKPGETPMSDAVRKLHLTGSDSLQVEGQNDLLVYRARCCNPIRGEEIVGYVTRGKGVAVHARGCPNVQNLLYESDRRINVEWSRVGDTTGRPQRYPVKITIYCDDRTGMLKELTAVISDDDTNIRNIDIRHDDSGEAIIEFIVEAEDVRHLNRMVLGLRRVSGVRDVQRTQKI
jgi:GTP pyrophosphokinase